MPVDGYFIAIDSFVLLIAFDSIGEFWNDYHAIKIEKKTANCVVQIFVFKSGAKNVLEPEILEVFLQNMYAKSEK